MHNGNIKDISKKKSIFLRRAKLKDLQEIYDIEKAVFDGGDCFSKQSLKRHIMSDLADFIVVDVGKRIVGYCTVFYRRKSSSSRIYNIAVHPDFQGMRLATLLMNKAKCFAGLRKMSSLYLEVHEKNSKAIKLYSSNGFSQFGIKKNYYSDGSSAIKMKCLIF